MNQLLDTLLAGLAENIPSLELTGLTLDNRQVQAGMGFVALRGTRQHGLAYAEAAQQTGAVVVLYEPEPALNLPSLQIPCVAVPHLREKLGIIADRFQQSPSQSLFMVGVTGTDGKTSITHFIAEALNAAGNHAGVIGTIGLGEPGKLKPATHTTPDALSVHRVLNDLRREGFDSVAMEVSSHALDQGRVNGVQFDVAVLSNLTRDHLDYHGTVEAYAEAKRILFHWQGLKTVVLNLDDAFGQDLAQQVKVPHIIGYGVGEPNQYPHTALVASQPVFNYQGIQATIHWQGQTGTLHAPVLGVFNLHNLLAALGVLLAKGLTLTSALTSLQKVWVVPGRMERVVSSTDSGKLVVVDYAHTPGALTQVLKAVRVHTQGKLICVFGCGGDRDRGKRPLMAAAAQNAADVVLVTDDNPRTENPEQIFTDIAAGFTGSHSIQWEHDRAHAIRSAIAQAQAGDTVLIAGKGHETVQIFADKQIPFDDRIQAAQALQEVAA